MKKSNVLPFISLLIISVLALAPFIYADSGAPGGTAGGLGGGAAGGSAGGLSGGSPGGTAGGLGGGAPGGSAGGLSGGAPGGSAGGLSGGTPSGTSGTSSSPGGGSGLIPGTAGGTPAGPGGGPGGTGSPGGPGPAGFPPEADAVWQDLPDKTITQGSRDGTVIQNDVFSKCSDPDDSMLTFNITSQSSNFNLAFVGDDLEIFDLDRNFIGTETVKLTCNGVQESFFLSVVAGARPVPRPIPPSVDDEDDDLSVYIGSIIMPNAYDAQAGDAVPVIISIKNTGDHKLEGMKAAIVIQDLGIRASFGPLDLPIGKRVSRTVNIELPEDVMPGTYYARITIDSGALHRVKHRDVEVIT